MNRTTKIGLCIIILIVLVGCDTATTSFNTQNEVNCQKICLGENLNLRYVSTTSTTLYCHCEKIITVEVEK